MGFYRDIGKKVYLFVLPALFIVFMLFYGGYYLVFPSERGENILKVHNIPYPALIAHRGASYTAPESTEPAYRIAHEMGIDYVEADIHRTIDGRLVVFHDDTLERTSNVGDFYPDRVDDHISTFTYKELAVLDYGTWFNEKHPFRAQDEYIGQQILTLERLLDITSDGEDTTGVVIEIKGEGRYENIEYEIIDLLANKNRIPNKDEEFADIIIFSFSLDLLKRFKRIAPELPRMLLLDDERLSRRKWSRWLDISEDHVDGLGIKGFVGWPWHIAEAHDRHMFVLPYVINELWQFRILAHLNSNGYITDRPDLAQNFLKIIPPEFELPALLDEDDKTYK